MAVQPVSNGNVAQFVRGAGQRPQQTGSPAADRNRAEQTKSQQQREANEAIRRSSEGVPDAFKQSFQFGLIPGTNQLFMKVVDNQSNETLDVRPSAAFLELNVQLEKMIGKFLDENA